MWKELKSIEENGYEIVGPPVAVCHNNSHTALEEEQASECQFPVRRGKEDKGDVKRLRKN